MNIVISDSIPDLTYFRLSDVAPEIEGDHLMIFHGKGTRRSWGAPQVNSTVVLQEDDLIAVFVGFSHKHKGGQGWFFFENGTRRTWGQLDNDQRTRVLSAAKSAPSWAKSPGKLKADTPRAAAPRLAYKYVDVRPDGRMVSLWNGEGTEYKIGKRLAEAAKPYHQGGYYAYPTLEDAKSAYGNQKLVPDWAWAGVRKIALIECEIGGRIVEYDNGKIAATYLKPIRVIETIDRI